jgi:thiosulfate reductase cytochrome b subunit
MNAAVERKIIRWIHLLASIPIAGYIYGPVADIPRAAFAVKVVFVPLVVLSGLWMWQGHRVKKTFTRKPPRKRKLET